MSNDMSRGLSKGWFINDHRWFLCSNKSKYFIFKAEELFKFKRTFELIKFFSHKEEIGDCKKSLGMVWDVNTDLITYNAKSKNPDEFINAVNVLKRVSKSD